MSGQEKEHEQVQFNMVLSVLNQVQGAIVSLNDHIQTLEPRISQLTTSMKLIERELEDRKEEKKENKERDERINVLENKLNLTNQKILIYSTLGSAVFGGIFAVALKVAF